MAELPLDVPILPTPSPRGPVSASFRERTQSGHISNSLILSPVVDRLIMACKSETSPDAARGGQAMLSQETGHSRESPCPVHPDPERVGSRLDEKVLHLTEPVEGPDYPKGMRLSIIIASLAISVFLCALVRSLHSTGFCAHFIDFTRTKPLSQP